MNQGAQKKQRKQKSETVPSIVRDYTKKVLATVGNIIVRVDPSTRVVGIARQCRAHVPSTTGRTCSLVNGANRCSTTRLNVRRGSAVAGPAGFDCSARTRVRIATVSARCARVGGIRATHRFVASDLAFVDP